jgi:hypothetical protein
MQSGMNDPRQRVQAGLAEVFRDATGYDVRQKFEWLEILSPFERRNKYDILVRGHRQHAGIVEEQSRSVFNLIGRQLLGNSRAALLTFNHQLHGALLDMKKPFRFYFHQLAVNDATGVVIGSIRRRFHLFRTRYELCDEQGNVLLMIRGPFFVLPFMSAVYRLMKDNQEVGRIAKQWKGLLREGFTDNDAFRSTMDPLLPLREKILVFAAVFLIDFVSYENNQTRD